MMATVVVCGGGVLGLESPSYGWGVVCGGVVCSGWEREG